MRCFWDLTKNLYQCVIIMKKTKFNIMINSEQSDYTEMATEVLAPLAQPPEELDVQSEKVEFYTEGELTVTKDGKYCLSYDESKLTGMDGSVTSVNFDMKNPELVTLMRSGNYRMAMVFESGKRHICTYQTPYMPIELCVVTKRLENTLTKDGGSLSVDYSIETNGMKCEITRLRLTAQRCER